MLIVLMSNEKYRTKYYNILIITKTHREIKVTEVLSESRKIKYLLIVNINVNIVKISI